MRSYCLCIIILFLTLAGCSSHSNTDQPPGGSGGGNGDDTQINEGGDNTGGGGVSDVAPTIYDEFTSESAVWSKQVRTPGSVVFGASEPAATDQSILRITVQGNPLLASTDYVGPSKSNQIATNEKLSFGSYRVRANIASCALPAAEEVITGIFTYSYGGDTNANGITDNNEIDIETACSMPSILMLTVWTDYDDDTHFQKVTRMVDMLTGEYYQTEAGKEGEYGVGHEPLGTIPGIAGSGFDITKNFYEIGFDWYSEQIRYFVVIDGAEITLWDYSEKTRIPQNASKFLFNLWHTDENWDSGAVADYPSTDAVLEVDWFKYWAQ